MSHNFRSFDLKVQNILLINFCNILHSRVQDAEHHPRRGRPGGAPDHLAAAADSAGAAATTPGTSFTIISHITLRQALLIQLNLNIMQQILP